MKLKKWDHSCQDCRRALDIDQNLVKAHFFLGQSLLELELFDEAIKHLQRACDLAKEQNRNFGDDIASQLRLARKRRFNVQEEKRICKEIELQSYLNRCAVKNNRIIDAFTRGLNIIQLIFFFNFFSCCPHRKRLINDEMETRLANIKLEDEAETVNEDELKQKRIQIEQDCVRKYIFDLNRHG